MKKFWIAVLMLLVSLTVIVVVYTVGKALGGRNNEHADDPPEVTEWPTPTEPVLPTPTNPEEQGDNKGGGLSSVEGLDMTPIPTRTPSVTGGGSNDSQEEELDAYGWDGSDLTGILNLQRLNEVAGKLYAEKLDEGYAVSIVALTKEDMGRFESDTVYYNDLYGYLYLNMKLSVVDGAGKEEIRYVTLKLGYEGKTLKIYEQIDR